MTKDNITITARFEKAEFVGGGPEDAMELETVNGRVRVDHETRTGLKAEWFPGQDRSQKHCTKLRLGGVVEGGYASAEYVARYENAGGTDFDIVYDDYRLDAEAGLKLALDIPAGTGLISPYAESAVGVTWLSDSEDWQRVVNTGSGPRIWRSFVSPFTPEVGVDVFVPLASGVRTVLNAHGKVMHFDAAEETTQLYVGGGIGVAF